MHKPAKRPDHKDGAEHVADEPARQSAQHGNDRRGERQERGRYRHEDVMLRHVHKEQAIAEGVERRGYGDEQGDNPGEEAAQSPRRKKSGAGAADFDPAADVKDGNERWLAYVDRGKLNSQ